jgi:hypothetical protein
MTLPNPLPTDREKLEILAQKALSEENAAYPGDFIAANRSARAQYPALFDAWQKSCFQPPAAPAPPDWQHTAPVRDKQPPGYPFNQPFVPPGTPGSLANDMDQKAVRSTYLDALKKHMSDHPEATPIAAHRAVMDLQVKSVTLYQEDDKPPLRVLNIRHEILGWVFVQDRWAALAALQDTFAAVGIASHAQLAWYNSDELIWHDHFPKPMPVPFALRLEAAKEWHSQSAKFGEYLKLVGKIIADSLQAQKRQDEFVEKAKDLLKSVEQAINQQPPLPPPQ